MTMQPQVSHSILRLTIAGLQEWLSAHKFVFDGVDLCNICILTSSIVLQRFAYFRYGATCSGTTFNDKTGDDGFGLGLRTA